MCNEILKLKDLIEKEGIPFEFETRKDGYQLVYPSFSSNGNFICSVVEFPGTYGYEDDKLEIMGLLTFDEYTYDTVVGHLTAEDVFERIKKHYEEYPEVISKWEN